MMLQGKFAFDFPHKSYNGILKIDNSNYVNNSMISPKLILGFHGNKIIINVNVK